MCQLRAMNSESTVLNEILQPLRVQHTQIRELMRRGNF